MRRIYSLFFLLPLLAFAQAKLVVCITAQNDEETILRCLKSVEKFADYIYLADLGSTDETLQLAADFFDEGAVEGTIEKTERSLFASNREQTLENAKKTAGKLGYSLRQTYFLFLDAAMIAQFNEGWKKKDLVKNDGYRIYQKWPHLGHSRLCLSLIRGSLSWKQKGVLQDDWSAEAFQAEKLDSLAIENLAEPKPERLQKEIEQCKEVLAADPQNGKALLQLGFAYRSLKQFGDAAEAFNQRIQAGGDPEERWFSKYMIGRCQEEAGEWADALYWYLEAFEENTARGEPLLRISRHYRVRGENDLSYLFAKHGTRTQTGETGSLFDETPYNSYQLHEDLSIAAFYTQFKDDGFASADRVLLNPNTPWYGKDHTYRSE